ncbi:MAG: Gram-negative bacterial TonB protein C-terminal [Candidatus Eremiobacteraeota bacterium]|nr:Gram-negative bacterial TonB protein C-terminal [Candidatus Eremiobacteraeota bacterium]
MTKTLILCCALVAASSALTPLAVGAAPVNPPQSVATSISCQSAHTDAAVIFAAPAYMPVMAHEQGFKGTAYVEVALAQDGKLAAARVARSSGNRLVDAAALSTVRATTFRAESINCTPVAGAYLYVVDFDE